MNLTTRLRMDQCPNCQQKLDAATSMKGKTPKIGDVTVCIECATILQWNQQMHLEIANTRDIPLHVLDELAGIVAAVHQVKAGGKR